MYVDETLLAAAVGSKNEVLEAIFRQRFPSKHGGDYVSFDSRLISFMPYNKILTYGDNWKSRQRVSMTPGKAIRALYNYEHYYYEPLVLTDEVIEKAHNDLVSAYAIVTGAFVPEIISGRDIVEAYSSKNYSPQSGNLLDSCMQYDRCSTYFGLYTENDKCNMVVVRDNEGRLLGRALLWEAVLVNNDSVEAITYLDRVYGNDIVTSGLQTYANKQGWWYRSDYDTAVSPSDRREVIINKKDYHIRVYLDHLSFSYYPYVDSFPNRYDTYISSYSDDLSDLLRDQNGGIIIRSMRCQLCEQTTAVGNSMNNLCFNCYDLMNTVECSRCHEKVSLRLTRGYYDNIVCNRCYRNRWD